MDSLWLAVAAATTLAAAAGVKTGNMERTITTMDRVKGLTHPKPGDNMRKNRVKPKKVQLAKQSKAALSEVRLAKMWAEQVSTKAQPVETNCR